MLRWRKLKINDILNEFLILNEYEIFQEKFIVLLEQFIYQLVLLQKLNHKNFEQSYYAFKLSTIHIFDFIPRWS